MYKNLDAIHAATLHLCMKCKVGYTFNGIKDIYGKHAVKIVCYRAEQSQLEVYITVFQCKLQRHLQPSPNAEIMHTIRNEC